MKLTKEIETLLVPPNKKINLADYDPKWNEAEEFAKLGKAELKKRANEILAENRLKLTVAQELLWASDIYSILIILQGIDSAGKDGMIKHIMEGVNPQGCEVVAFKQPTTEELDHDFFWRCYKALPERGRIGIFNRSYYEDVLVVKVHPEYLTKLPGKIGTPKFWQERYEDINVIERHLVRNGTVILKFFLNISKEEQRKRFLERLENPDKNWKFSPADLAERAYWDNYQKAYQDMLNGTSTEWAPWYIIPCDRKWVGRALVADIITRTILSLDLEYPRVDESTNQELIKAKVQLESEA